MTRIGSGAGRFESVNNRHSAKFIWFEQARSASTVARTLTELAAHSVTVGSCSRAKSNRDVELFAKRTEVRVVERVALAVGGPSAFQGGKLSREAHSIFFPAIASTGFGFVMDQHSARLVEGLPTSGVELEAKVDVVEGHWKIDLVEASDREELLLGDH